MEFIKIDEKERKLLLDIFNIKERKCQFCGVIEKNCAIMPAVNTNKLATIICNSPLCLSQYFTLTENKNKR
jgi:hypothetical protein